MTASPRQPSWEEALQSPPEVSVPRDLVPRLRTRLEDFRARRRRALWRWAVGYGLALVLTGIPWLALTWLVFPPSARTWMRRMVVWHWALPLLWNLLRETLGRSWLLPALVLSALAVLGTVLWVRWVALLWQRQALPARRGMHG